MKGSVGACTASAAMSETQHSAIRNLQAQYQDSRKTNNGGTPGEDMPACDSPRITCEGPATHGPDSRCVSKGGPAEPLGRTSTAEVKPPEEYNGATSIYTGEEDLPLSFAPAWHPPLGLLWERRCLNTIDN